MMLKQNDAVRKLLNVDKWHKAGYTGKNKVAVILDGAKGKPRKGMESYYTDVFGTATESGHGTNVGQTIHEIAPDAKILYFDNTRNKDAVFNKVEELAKQGKANIINVSMAGISGMTAPDYLRYQALCEKYGIVMVCGAGNDGYTDHVSYPARYDFTIAIGSTDKTGTKVDGFSNKGPKLTAVCPDYVAIVNDEGKIWIPSGTSYATPVSVGELLCYSDWKGTLNTEETLDLIKSSSRDIYELGRDDTSGHGLFCLPATIPVVDPVPIIPLPVDPLPIPEPIKEKEVICMPRIYISPSTQEANRGVSPFSTEEKEMNAIADILMQLLDNDGRFEFKRNYPSMTPYQCADDSNNFKADIHVAIHSNAGGGVGTEVFAYGPGTNSERLGKCFYDQIAPLSPGADRGVKYNPKLVEVGVLVNATSALIELAFHDNQSEATWLAYNHQTIAQKLYMGVCDYFGYSYKALVVAPVVVPPVASAEDYDIHLSVRCYKSLAPQAIKDINKLGFAAKIMDLA